MSFPELTTDMQACMRSRFGGSVSQSSDFDLQDMSVSYLQAPTSKYEVLATNEQRDFGSARLPSGSLTRDINNMDAVNRRMYWANLNFLDDEINVLYTDFAGDNQTIILTFGVGVSGSFSRALAVDDRNDYVYVAYEDPDQRIKRVTKDGSSSMDIQTGLSLIPNRCMYFNPTENRLYFVDLDESASPPQFYIKKCDPDGNNNSTIITKSHADLQEQTGFVNFIAVCWNKQRVFYSYWLGMDNTTEYSIYCCDYNGGNDDEIVPNLDTTVEGRLESVMIIQRDSLLAWVEDANVERIFDTDGNEVITNARPIFSPNSNRIIYQLWSS